MGITLFPVDKQTNERTNGCTNMKRLAVDFALRTRPKTATVAAGLHGYKTWCLTLREE